MKKVIWQKTFRKENYQSHPDYIIMGIIGAFVVFGLLFLSSASNFYSIQKFGNVYYVVFHQFLTGVLPGIFLFYFFLNYNYNKFEKYYFAFYLLSVALLLLVFVPGLAAEYGRSRSWINLFGFSFQPAEAVKLTFLIFFSGWLQAKGIHLISNLKQGIAPFLLYFLILLYLIMKQPDLGTLMIIVFMAASVYFVAGIKISRFLTIGTAGIAALVIKILKTPYLGDRLKVFLNPETDISSTGYQLSQSFLAIGSGGFFGRGLGKSQQKFLYLPEVSSDSIFSIIAEEMGFIIVFILIALFLVFVYRGIKTAVLAPDPFGRFLAVGIVSWISFQAFLNMAVMSGLAPLTGIPFPFISAGGTSMAINLAAVGLLLNISKHKV